MLRLRKMIEMKPVSYGGNIFFDKKWRRGDDRIDWEEREKAKP